MYMLRKTLYMKRIISFMIVLVALITVSVKSFAQQKNKPDSIAIDSASEKSYVLIGTGYTSGIVFLGRKSPLRSPYFSVSRRLLS